MITDERDTEAMMSNEVVLFLSKAIEAWQEVWLAVASTEGQLDLQQFYKPEGMLQNLILTAQLCAVYFQVSWPHPCTQLKSAILGVL